MRDPAIIFICFAVHPRIKNVYGRLTSAEEEVPHVEVSTIPDVFTWILLHHRYNLFARDQTALLKHWFQKCVRPDDPLVEFGVHKQIDVANGRMLHRLQHATSDFAIGKHYFIHGSRCTDNLDAQIRVSMLIGITLPHGMHRVGFASVDGYDGDWMTRPLICARILHQEVASCIAAESIHHHGNLAIDNALVNVCRQQVVCQET
mmetsp:Transcript_102310/g.259859  ORF Transcript_102310/g.259859 Transcript_102310/m.259859 type:complete len:204 (-) Transcript_102310:258-869(-)